MNSTGNGGPQRAASRRRSIDELRFAAGITAVTTWSPIRDEALKKSAPAGSPRTLTELLRETETHHGEYEPTAPKHHWSGWYAAYLVARERGATSDQAVRDAARHIEGTLERAQA